jgi:cellulose synthase/poly-beta-1,6-N-acetylglucosamine synthase-like glycosyltransferase
MDWLNILSLFLLLAYILITMAIHFGLGQKISKRIRPVSVSIIIAARNEEENLEECLHAIENLKNTQDEIDILIVNDRSEDRTLEIAENFCTRHSNFNLLNITTEKYCLSGKMNALAQGIEKTSGEIIFITDADCQVPPHWVNEMLKYFDSEVGMCGGLTLLSKKDRTEGFFTNLQTLDWIFLQAAASGSCHLGMPVSILGNNFAFRRKAYEEIGGFIQSGFSVTEDMLLLQAIYRTANWKIVYPLNKFTTIYSKPVKTVREFYRQRKRWVLGGKNTHWWAYLISLVSLITHLLILALILSSSWYFALISFILTMIADVSLYGRILKRINRSDLYKVSLPFKLYYIFYTIIFSFILLIGRSVHWKNATYKV